jgi:hypothetical protein
MTLVRSEADRLRVWTFADTTAYVLRPDGAVLTVGEAPHLRGFEAAKARELLDLTGCTPATITGAPAFRSWLHERRERQARSGGPTVLSLRPEAAEDLRHDEMAAPPGTVVLLTSDGLSALVDLYERFTPESLMQAALMSGLEPLTREARRIETAFDPSGGRYPRFKTSDDATGLLLRVFS